MKDPSRTNQELIEENSALKERIRELEQSESERKQAEEALRAVNAYNRSLIEASMDPLVTISPDGKITDVNTATEQATGCTKDVLIGTDFSNYFSDPEAARVGYRRVFTKGHVRDYPLEIRHCDGHVTPVLYNATLYHNENGEVSGIFAAARNITELKKAEEEIRTMALMLDTAPNSITVHDFDGRFLYANQRTFDLHGFNRDEFLALNLHQLDVPDSEKIIAPRMQELLNRGEATFEVAHCKKDGSTLPMEVSARITTWGDKKVILSVATDITERKRAEDELAKYRDGLEQMVKERTQELENKTKAIEEINIALKVLLQHREEDKHEMEDRFVINIRNLVMPFAEKMKNTPLDERQRAYLGIIEKHLHELMSPLVKKMQQFNFTPTELEVASLINEGKTTKAMAKLMGIANSSISTHRNNIRKKLGIGNKNVNLRSYLQSLR